MRERNTKAKAGTFILIFLMVFFIGGKVNTLAASPGKDDKAPANARHFNISRSQSDHIGIKIDGVPDEPAWQEAVKIPLPFEWMPGENIAPPVETQCLVTYSRTTLYIAFRCFDPSPAGIRAHYMDRDSELTFVQDDFVGIMLDTFNDERRAYTFKVNPLGVQMDAVYNEMESKEDYSWDAIWNSAGKITDSGYTVEIAIPFTRLRFPKESQGQTWGISAERSYPRSVRHQLSSHKRARNIQCVLCQANKLNGFESISPGRNVSVVPTLTVGRTDTRADFPQGEMGSGKVDVEPGISALWGVTPNLTLNTAINPDFSQVEADAAQLDVNTRFALRYPEKRPFFLEGGDYFLTPMEAVFTRTVYDPLWGAKLTGKFGKNAVGFFTTQDRYNNLLFPSNQGSTSTSIEENVFGGVFRYRRDIGKNSNIGALYSGRMNGDYSNHVVGVDGFIRFSGPDSATFQYLSSRTDYSSETAVKFGQEEEAFSGNAFFAGFKHSGRSFRYAFEYESLSSGFRADYGFIPRVDIRKYMGSLQKIFYGKRGGWFNWMYLKVRGTRITDSDNDLTDSNLELIFTYQGPLQSMGQVILYKQEEFFMGVKYDITRLLGFVEMKPTGGLKGSLFTRYGDSIDYANSRLAKSFVFNPALEFAVGRHFNLNLEHIFERLSFGGRKVYHYNLSQARLVYNISLRAFVRAIVQYSDMNRNGELYDAPITPRSKNMFLQFLFSYKLNPQTVLFLGYSDNHTGYRDISLTRKNRTFFLKIGYALVL
ncbi:MAG: carbohydrate binding family 9 domain-containing protein [bacterium]|nr:carbohydrate binding family 9 domain-containing protein [bacterium]